LGLAAIAVEYLHICTIGKDAAGHLQASPHHVANLFSVRNAVDPAEAYRAFRGRDAKIDALMRDRGFPVPDDAGE